MSVLIKGIEMPTKHFIKGFYIDGETGNVLDISRKSIIGHAIEVPTPHGRLIDADELLEKQFEEEHTHDYIVYADDVDDASIVIEAEK